MKPAWLVLLALMTTPATLPSESVNLARPEQGVMVYTSSYANGGAQYSESLIDGKPDTYWQAFDTTMPQWIELRWIQPVRIERIQLAVRSPSQIGSWRAAKWDHGEWRPLGESRGDTLACRSESLTRLRVTIETAEGVPLRLAGIEAHGTGRLSIENLRPYWSASYIWHAEPGQKLQVGKPRYFRVTFQVPRLAEVLNAALQSRSNDYYVAYVNGQRVATGNVDIRAVTVKEALREGENVFAYEAVANSSPGWSLMELLGELTVNTASGPLTVATGPDWKSCERAAEGWNRPGFKEEGWTPVAVFVKPPAGVWGRIPFNPVAYGEMVEVVASVFEPARAQPGQTIKARIKLKPRRPLATNFGIELRAGDVEFNRDRGNYLVALDTAVPAPPLNAWKAGEARWVDFTLELPDHAPGGPLPLQLSAAALDGRGQALRFQTADGRDWNAACGGSQLTVDRPVFQPGESRWTPCAIRWEGSMAAVRFGDQTVPPIFYALQSTSFERFHEYARTGPRIFRLETNPYMIEPDTDYATPHLAYLDQNIVNFLRTVPDGYLLLYVDLRTSGAWKKRHPEACLQDAFGNRRAECLSSREYQAAAADYLRRVIDFLRSKPYAGRILGLMPYLGPEVESCIGGVDINQGEVDRTKWTVGDWNPQALDAFRDFLRRKYQNDVARLRQAWRNDPVRFESAAPDRARLTEAAPDHNLFRDPRAGRMRADYFEFLSSIVPRAYEQVGRLIKEATQGAMLTGSYYGYVVEGLRGINPPCAVQQNNHFGYSRLIDSTAMDFYASPLHYEYSRLAGTRFLPFQPYASVVQHRKLYVAEEDQRTFICGEDYCRHRSQEETLAVLRRDLATTLIGGSGAWFADWSTGTGRKSHGYFLDDATLQMIRQAYRIHRDALQTKPAPKSATQIAVVISPETPWHQDCAYPSIVYNTLVCHVIYQALATLGAPFDILLIDDLKRPDVRDRYKLWVMINPFYLSREQGEWLDALQGNGRTLLWFYAPGYVSDEAGLSAEQVARRTGLGVKLLRERHTPAFRAVDDRSPVTQGVDAREAVTLVPYGSTFNFATIMPTEIFPNFLVDDPQAVVLGRDDRGRARFALRDFGAWRSVYSAVPNLPQSILRNIAQWAGVHLYTESGLVVEANDRYLMVHQGGKEARQVAVALPRPAMVVDLYENRTVAANQAKFDIVLPRMATRLFQLNPP